MFDGVHLGHRSLIAYVQQIACERGMDTGVITFATHPREVLHPDTIMPLLTDYNERMAHLADTGIDNAIVLKFNSELAQKSAREFISLLHDCYNVKVLCIGYDHRFGHNRAEGFDDYVRYGRELGIDVIQGEMERIPGEEKAVSSSVIRQLLEEGQVERMPDCLTRFYALTGTIVPGEHIGHELGFPTANLEVDHPHKLIPASGVYAVWAEVNGERMPAMMNISEASFCVAAVSIS
jgi:riboflavin kinase/FMN adenylyltransferase